jgi:RNA polymerase sigma-70 factor (ECF subfamily)
VDINGLVGQAKEGNKEALVQLIMAQKASYYRLAYVYTQNKEDAMDAMQEMILLVYQKIDQLKNNDSFYTWSKTILVNIVKRRHKKNRKVISIEEIKAETIDAYNSENRLDLEMYLNKLSYKHQEVIRLRYFLDLDYETMSQLLKIPLGTVKSRLHAGIKILKESFGGDYYGE